MKHVQFSLDSPFPAAYPPLRTGWFSAPDTGLNGALTLSIMAIKNPTSRQKSTGGNRYLLWASHFLMFGFGALTGIMVYQASVGGGSSVPTAAPSIAPPSNDLFAVIQQLETHLSHAPDDAEARTRLGNAYFDSGKFESAVLQYGKALELRPGVPDVIVDLGISYRNIGRSEVAVEKFREALAIEPRHVNGRYNLGIVLRWDLNKFPEAIAAWDTLLMYHPQHPNAATIRAQIQEMRNNPG